MRILTPTNGFTLVQAIFIIVVLGLLGSFMITMFQVQTRTTTLSHQGIRAYYAAKSGLEWGKNYTLSEDNCNSTLFESNETLSVGNFQVNMTCKSTNFTVDGESYKWFHITAEAEPDAVDYTSPDYVRRELSMQLANDTLENL